MSVLKEEKIREYLSKNDLKDRLVITPLLDGDEAIGASSIDIRLGTEFILMRKRYLGILDIRNQNEIEKNIYAYQEKIRINYQESFTIHPGQLILGSNLEYLSLPEDLMAYVIGKSTWGRAGLIIATATKIDPGFKGSITLEMVNLGEAPIVLYPGIPIAQLVLHKSVGKGKYTGRYKNPTGPQFPKISHNTKNWLFWLDKIEG